MAWNLVRFHALQFPHITIPSVSYRSEQLDWFLTLSKIKKRAWDARVYIEKSSSSGVPGP